MKKELTQEEIALIGFAIDKLKKDLFSDVWNKNQDAIEFDIEHGKTIQSLAEKFPNTI